MTQINNKRLDWLDMAKGYGILLVILGHIVVEEPYHSLIYSFHMPLFFFLSGIVYRSDVGFVPFVKKKAKSLLLPYLFLGLLLAVWGVLIETMKSGFQLQTVLGELEGLIVQRQWTSAWFLPCLFLTSVIYHLLRRTIRKKSVLVLLLCAVSVAMRLYYRYVGVILPWNLDRALASLIFFGAGEWFHECRLQEWIGATKRRATLIAAASLLLLVSCHLLFMNAFGGLLDFGHGSFPSGTHLVAFFGIAMVVAAASLGCNRAILYVGCNSLYYFAIHQRMVIATVQYAFNRLGLFQEGAAYVIGRVLIFAACLVLCTIFSMIVHSIKKRMSVVHET